MAIKINVQQKPIEFDINGVEFTVKRSDEIFKKYQKITDDVTVKYQALGEEDTKELIELRKLIKPPFDGLLGSGAYEKVEKTLSEDGKGQYTIQMALIFFQAWNGYAQEFMDFDNPYAE